MPTSKKSIFISVLIALIVCVTGLVSCNEREDNLCEESVNLINDENCETIKTLQIFNNEYVKENIPSQDTRGWKFTLAEVLSVGLADFSGACSGAKLGGQLGAIVGPNGAIVGATIGGVICGAASSFAQYKMSETIKEFRPCSTSTFQGLNQKSFEAAYAREKDYIQQSDYRYGIALGLDSCATKIAILHNKVLDIVEDIDNTGNYGSYISHFNVIEMSVVNDGDFIKMYKKLSVNPTFKADPTSVMDSIMSLFIAAVNNNVNQMSDLDSIIQFYSSTVRNSSDLNQIEKDALLSGFAVMKYSAIYWSSKPIIQLNNLEE